MENCGLLPLTFRSDKTYAVSDLPKGPNVSVETDKFREAVLQPARVISMALCCVYEPQNVEGARGAAVEAVPNLDGLKSDRPAVGTH